MTINTTQVITGLLATLLALPLAQAQDDATEEVVEPRRYSVEIIVFSYAENVAVGTEVFPPDEPFIPDADRLPGDLDAMSDGVAIDAYGEPISSISDTNAGDKAAGDERVTTLMDIEPVLTINDDMSLQRVKEQLRRLDAYKPIMHTGWTQTTLPLEASIPLELPYFGNPPDRLEGSFMLYLGRYLHLVVDLTLDAPGQVREYGEPTVSFGDERLQYPTDRNRKAGVVRYRIQEDRIVKNGDIRYFDHPKFGVIAKITRVEDPEEELEAEPDSLVASPLE